MIIVIGSSNYTRDLSKCRARARVILNYPICLRTALYARVPPILLESWIPRTSRVPYRAKFTMELDFFKSKLTEQGIEVIIPNEADRILIMQLFLINSEKALEPRLQNSVMNQLLTNYLCA